MKKALQLSPKVFGPNHEMTATFQMELGLVNCAFGEADEAQSAFEQARLMLVNSNE